MKVTMMAVCSEDPDGVDQTLILTSGADNIYDLMNQFSNFSRAAGFSFVDRIGYATDKGAEHWSSF